MQNNRVWQRACGLTATVVEGIRFDEAAEAIVCRLDLTLGRAADADGAAAGHPVMTEELVGHVGEFSTLTPRPKLTHGYSRRATYAL